MQILLKTRLFWNRVGKWSPNYNSQKHVCSVEYKFTGSLVTLSPSIVKHQKLTYSELLGCAGLEHHDPYSHAHQRPEELPEKSLVSSTRRHMSLISLQRSICEPNVKLTSSILHTSSQFRGCRHDESMEIWFDISKKTQTKIPLFQLSSTLDALRKETGHDISQL